MEKKKFLLLPIVAIIVTAFAFIPSANADDVTVTYSAHVQTYGDQAAVTAVNDTSILSYAGTVGEAKRLEALTINLKSSVDDVKIQYAAHVQSIGWQDFVSAGTMAGTSGLAKRVEAISIVTSGLEDAGYVLKYRAHVQSYGWMDWKTADDDGDLTISDSDDFAGTTGLAKRLEAIEIVLVPTAEQALKDAKSNAKEELKSFVESDAVNAETIDGTKNSVTLASDITKANNAIADNGSIDKAKTIEAVEKIVSKIESDAAKTIRTALKANLKSNYNSESKVVYDAEDETNYSLSTEDYQKAYDAIDTASTVEEAVQAYNNAMEARIDIDALRENASDEIDAYVKANDGLNKYVVTATNSANYISDKRTYSREDAISTIIENQKTAVSSNSVNLSNVKSEVEKAIEKIRSAVVNYAKTALTTMYTNSSAADLVLSDDNYLDAFKALQADSLTEEEALDIYENAAFGRTNKWQSELTKRKDEALEELKAWNTTKYTYNDAKYTLSADAFVEAVNDATSVVNNAELVNETESSYNVAAKEISDVMKELKDKFTDGTILDDTNLKTALSNARTAAIGHIESYVGGTASNLPLTDEETVVNNDTALNTITFENGDNLYDYVYAIVDNYKYTIKYDTETVDEVANYEKTAVNEILATIRTTLASKVNSLYNNGYLYTINSDDDTRVYYNDKSSTINTINDSDNDLDAIIAAYTAYTAQDYVISTQIADLKTAVDAVDTDLAKNSGITTLYNDLVKKLKTGTNLTNVVADKNIETTTQEILVKFKQYIVSELTTERNEYSSTAIKSVYTDAITEISSMTSLSVIETKYNEISGKYVLVTFKNATTTTADPIYEAVKLDSTTNKGNAKGTEVESTYSGKTIAYFAADVDGNKSETGFTLNSDDITEATVIWYTVSG